MRSSVAVAAVFWLAGCYPVFSHPTRVDPGFRLASYASVSLVSDSSIEEGRTRLAAMPSIDFEASLGVRDTSRDNGYGLRLAASGGFSGFGVSTYVELPRGNFGMFDTGVGLAVHGGVLSMWTPYVQFGRHEDEDMSWFVRNGVAFVTPADSSRRSVLWLPTVGIARHRPYRDSALFLSAVVGNQQLLDGPCYFSCEGPSLRTLVMVGASVSFTLMTPYRPDRR